MARGKYISYGSSGYYGSLATDDVEKSPSLVRFQMNRNLTFIENSPPPRRFSGWFGRLRLPSVLFLSLGTILLVSHLLPPNSTSQTSPQQLSPATLSGTYSAQQPPYSLAPPSTFSPSTGLLQPYRTIDRPASSSPNPHLFPSNNAKGGWSSFKPLPTNAWFQNFLIGGGDQDEANKVYTIPYVVDTMFGVIQKPLEEEEGNDFSANTTTSSSAGLRIHAVNVAPSGDKIVQVEYETSAGLGLGGKASNPLFSIAKAYNVRGETTALGLELEWRKVRVEGRGSSGSSSDFEEEEEVDEEDVAAMHSPIIRGSPYMTMHYNEGITPIVSSTFFPMAADTDEKTFVIVDSNVDLDIMDEKYGERLRCSNTDEEEDKGGHLDAVTPSVLVNHHVVLHFSNSDMTWIVYVSRPIKLSCRTTVAGGPFAASLTPPPSIPGVPPAKPGVNFELFTAEPLTTGLTLRVALANNCTTGQNPTNCEKGAKPRDQTDLVRLLNSHSDVYPTTAANVEYTFPTLRNFDADAKDVLLHFSWGAMSMKERDAPKIPGTNISGTAQAERDKKDREEGDAIAAPKNEILMYALPHHVEVIETTVGSTNGLAGHCSPTLHGSACLVLGGNWVMREYLTKPPTFNAPRPPKATYIDELAKALNEDIHYELPKNYMVGAGDTYFSGKMLAKLARIIVIADELKTLASEIGDVDGIDDERADVVRACAAAKLPSEEDMMGAVDRLRSGVSVWLNGESKAPFVYDAKWGGIVNCGCNFNSATVSCDNQYPTCPGVLDAGSNFGHGFYNDHHFHHGYHIYAAATVAKYDALWARDYFEPVLSLIRDIANPSPEDNYFPVFRHKDWYLGSSWASGIALIGGDPYPNGRNQESSSEAIAAYEAVALYGDVLYHKWGGDNKGNSDLENSRANVAARVRDMGRLLLATELRSTDRYWHVRKNEKNRIYPKEYTPGVVGMLWSLMAQFQTWFGSAPYLGYGIQLMPLTPVAENRDEVLWAEEVYPIFKESCLSDEVCENQGWSILLFGLQATVGDPENALLEVLKIPAGAFVSPGGNGHSLSNTIWWISTRPEVEYKEGEKKEDDEEKEGSSNGGSSDASKGPSYAGVLTPPRACSHAECTSFFNRCPLPGAPYLCLLGPPQGGCSPLPWDDATQGFCLDWCELRAGC